jgi:hypothetical protein
MEVFGRAAACLLVVTLAFPGEPRLPRRGFDQDQKLKKSLWHEPLTQICARTAARMRKHPTSALEDQRVRRNIGARPDRLLLAKNLPQPFCKR